MRFCLELNVVIERVGILLKSQCTCIMSTVLITSYLQDQNDGQCGNYAEASNEYNGKYQIRIPFWPGGSLSCIYYWKIIYACTSYTVLSPLSSGQCKCILNQRTLPSQLLFFNCTFCPFDQCSLNQHVSSSSFN